MTGQLTVFKTANLPAVSELSKGLKNVKNEIGDSGVVILKMDKTGHWVYGADQTEVEDGSTWAVNPFSFLHGHIAWGEGAPLAEVMGPVTEPLPEPPAAPQGARKGWERQYGFALKCLDGEDKDLEVRFSTTSVGGKRAVQELANAIAEQVDKDQTRPVAVVTFKKDSYQHKQYGKIYTPIFEVLKFVTMEGADTPAVADATATPENGRRRRRTAA